MVDLTAYPVYLIIFAIMKNKLKNNSPGNFLGLSEEQWAFLAVIDAIGGPVSIDMAGKLYPLLPGPLIDLLDIAESRKWINKSGKKALSISETIDPNALEKLRVINNQKHLSFLIDRIHEEKLLDQIDVKVLAAIMHKAGRLSEAARCEIEMAQKTLEKFKHEQGLMHLKNAALCLNTDRIDPEIGILFISSSLEWLNISFALGKKSSDIESVLQKALEIADQLGDIRSRALLNLHLGKHYYFTDRRDEALVALSIGVDEIEELGDKDIHSQSAAFLGFYFFIQGRLEQALEHLEKAILPNGDEGNNKIKDPITTVLYGYCAAYLGKFHQALGTLDFHCRMAENQNDKVYASTVRSVLGTILVLLKKHKEADIHLEKAKKDARGTGNVMGLYLSGGGMSLNHFLKGDMEKAYDALKETVIQGTQAGLIRQFSSPWVLEMLYEFHHLGYTPVPSLELTPIMESIMEGVNSHLQGVCMRIKAKMIAGQSGAHIKIANFLEKSREQLEMSGDPVQLSKTLLEQARLELIQGNRDRANSVVLEARQVLGGYIEEFFPDEFLGLIENKGVFLNQGVNDEQFSEQYFEMIESLYPSADRMEILSKVLLATSQMFGAERSGLFWFSEGEYTKNPELRASLNLPRIEIDSSNFKPSLSIILDTYKKNRPASEKISLKEFSLGKKFVRSILCIPIEVTGCVHGVLYYDNSYLDNAFEFVNLSIIKRMAQHTNMVVERCIDHLKVRDKANRLASEKSLLLDDKNRNIITQSKKMHLLLKKVIQVAATESTVLILGETGTGKELIANLIHKKSSRSNALFIIVDSTTISENLIESELFGHEKGAFTGADKRKIGSIEMADQGTLFLDEVGELTLAAQSKLLRALQEKTIRRVGGVTSIEANFRLIAATNRDLAKEVEQSRFREDLYYRLNVVPFKLPPLRSRDNDPVLLAQHFIDRYAKKYNFPGFELSGKEKSAIMSYPWPGNVRELKNVMERAVLLSEGNSLELDLPLNRPGAGKDPFADTPTLDEVQRRYIQHILDQTNGKISGPGSACEILGMKRTSLYSRMKSLGFKKDR
jgi:transcriptional regulator with GAF, ATPase, and Fis domain